MATYSGTNAYTGTGSGTLGGTTGGAGLVQQAYDRLVEFALRAQPLIRDVADKKPVQQSIPGATVSLQIYKDLDKITSTLQETPDLDAVALGTPDIINLTLNEYGNAAITTRRLQLFSLADVDPAVSNIIAWNMADSIDDVAQTELLNGTNVIRQGGRTSTGAITDADVFNAAAARKTVAKLRANKAIYRKGSMYWAGIHPEVSHDLRKETGGGAWRTPHEYQTNDQIWAGEIGSFEGAYYVESPRLYSSVDGTTNSALSTTFTAATATATVGNSGGYTFATTVSMVGTAKVGDKVGGTGIATAAKITAFSVDGLTVTVDTANTAAVSGTITITPITKVYRTFFAGQQALAQAVAEEPHVVIGPITDKLQRFRPIGWYGVLGFKLYRQAALYRVESSSSIQV
jgi:N4-gp56 family major capsid protein